MNFLRQHWFDLGIVFAIVIGAWIFFVPLSFLSLLLWLNLIALFVHQFEEYRFPGYFPGMVNVVMFHSDQPDRYPLNANTSLLVNLLTGWLTYFLAAILGERAIWLGLATMLVSVGNFVAHTFTFNLKGRTIYNPGMITAIVFFLPLSFFFFRLVIQTHAATTLDWILGVALGIALNYLGILKMIDWLKDEHTPYLFAPRNLPPSLRYRR